MLPAVTEQLHAEASGLDARPLADVTSILTAGQVEAARSVAAASEAIARGAEAMARSIASGGVLWYVAAGSSGLMAAADAQELGGTFSIPARQLRILMAGGLPCGVEMPGDTEDDTSSLTDAFKALASTDTVIAVSASGTTPYTLEAARLARKAGATLIAIANNPGSALLEAADVPISLPTPPEVLSGSTRLGAGTAQKIALNTLSTAMAVRLGHVHDGMMVNLRADNIKLRRRARDMVCRIAGVEAETAQTALDTARGEVKLAILIAAYALSLPEAQTRLDEAHGNLRAALAPKTQTITSGRTT